MAAYRLYGEEIIQSDSSLNSFAKSVVKLLEPNSSLNHQKGERDDYFDKVISLIFDVVHDVLPRTDINYAELMCRYRYDLGNLLYEMDNHGYDITNVSFFEHASESFNYLLISYIEIHFDELMFDDV